MIHLGARAHAFVNGLFRPSDETLTRDLYDRVAKQFAAAGLSGGGGPRAARRHHRARRAGELRPRAPEVDVAAIADLVQRIFDYEAMFVLPPIDWTERQAPCRSTGKSAMG